MQLIEENLTYAVSLYIKNTNASVYTKNTIIFLSFSVTLVSIMFF